MFDNAGAQDGVMEIWWEEQSGGGHSWATGALLPRQKGKTAHLETFIPASSRLRGVGLEALEPLEVGGRHPNTTKQDVHV